MKMNVFIEQHELLKNYSELQIVTVGGHRAIDRFDPEEQAVDSIDKRKFTAEQWRAKKFVEFLGNRHLDVAKLKQLSAEEQSRLRKEFMESFEA